MKSYTLEQIRAMKGQTNWSQLREQVDFEGPDADDFEVDWSRAVMVNAAVKKPVSLRLDQDVIDFFKESGSGYQTRINAILRSYMRAHMAHGAVKKP